MRTAIIAGEGQLPVEIARKIQAGGETPVALCICSDPEKMRGLAEPVLALDRPKVSAGLKFFKENGVSRVIMAGAVSKKNIYSPSVLFDPATIKILANARRDDHSLLGAIVAWFESEGIEVVPYTSFLTRAVADRGAISHRAPSELEMRDILCGAEILKKLLPFSFGQSLVIAEGAVVAVEAMEGTDAMIERAGALSRKGVVVKMMRTDQDERYDLPTVGVKTIRGMANAGLSCLAVEAERTLIMELDEVITAAREHDIAIWGLDRQ